MLNISNLFNIIYTNNVLPKDINNKIIISFTSFPKRINTADKTLLSILNQSTKPDYIFLNLSIEEFPNKENDIPDNLLHIINKNNIYINFVEKDINVYKKFLPVIKHYLGQNYILFSIDDDIIYSNKYIEDNISYLKNTNADIISLLNVPYGFL